MNPIIRFLKLRKQNDKVKIAVLMFALAIGFAASACARLSDFWMLSSAPSEYILLPTASGSLSPEKITWLCGSDGVVSASIQRQYTAAVGTGNVQTPLPVAEVSRSYLADCFAIQPDTSGEDVYYLNQAAFDRLSAVLPKGSNRGACSVNGGTAHQARFLVCGSIPGELPAAFHAGTSAGLNPRTADSVRVMYQDSDITQLRETELSGAGFSIQNRQDLLTGTHEKESCLKDIMYDAVIIAIALTAGIALLPSRWIDSRKQ